MNKIEAKIELGITVVGALVIGFCVGLMVASNHFNSAFAPTPVWQPTQVTCHYMLKDPCHATP